MEKKVILVTGGSGQVGKAIQKVLKNDSKEDEEWIFLSSKDANLLNKPETYAVFEKYKPTHVIHLAATDGGQYAHIGHSCEFFRDNMNMNDNILEVSCKMEVKKLVSCLSTCIFPDRTTYPIDETMIHNGPPHQTSFGFSYAKRMMEVLNRAYNEERGCIFTSLIPCNIFGPHDNFNVSLGHVIPVLINKAYEAKKNGTPFEIWGSGEAMRQFIFSEDLAKLFIWAVREYEEIEPLIIAPDEADEISIKDVARMILEAFDFQGEIKFMPGMEDGQLKKTASNAKLRKYLPQFQFTSNRKAIMETVQWFKDNFETARK
eukprot:TRINITY_DN186_c0_g1_i1.p1 TRINITY_DN186_c0_g1~~TRINITY_DN186_c0_g1_i1.p1  ORF type:complete len:317 (-),score=82.22 TRINITY_DN186_c0_g1_i1:165-1115(-)